MNQAPRRVLSIAFTVSSAAGPEEETEGTGSAEDAGSGRSLPTKLFPLPRPILKADPEAGRTLSYEPQTTLGEASEANYY